MALVGNRYIQSVDPGAVGFGYQWIDTDNGILYERNTTNTSWVAIYDTSKSNGGLMPKTGGAFSGPVTGATGWATGASHNFTGSLQLAGQDVATQGYVDNAISQMSALIASKVSEGVNGYTSSVSAKSKIAIGSGYLYGGDQATVNTFEIPLPYFQDQGAQTQATEVQCKWIVFPLLFNEGAIMTVSRGTPLSKLVVYRNISDTADVNPLTSRQFVAYSDFYLNGANVKYPISIGYLIIGVR